MQTIARDYGGLKEFYRNSARLKLGWCCLGVKELSFDGLKEKLTFLLSFN
jgi:hypothetical protein